eukprot:1960243-Pyramimonas_sp.AAC.1
MCWHVLKKGNADRGGPQGTRPSTCANESLSNENMPTRSPMRASQMRKGPQGTRPELLGSWEDLPPAAYE